MNENIDLTRILKDCPKGTKLYSPLYGEVTLNEINLGQNYPVEVSLSSEVLLSSNVTENFTKDGKLYDDESYKNTECVLFPSKEQRDWSKFTAPWLKKERDAIAWLKEQGGQEEPQVYETEDGKIITYSETDGYKFDEPRFKVGDWVTIKQ